MSISNKDNTLRGARNTGNLGGSKRINGLVGLKDKIDFARFSLSEVSQFGLTLGRIAGRASAKVTLRNEQGFILQTLKGGAKAKTFSGKLPAGTYFLGIQRLRGEIGYKLTASATRAEPGENLSTARDIGVLSGTYVNPDFVGTNDLSDIYKFTLNDVANLQARVDNFASKTRLELIRDANSNGLIDNDEILASDFFGSSAVSSITQDLPPGTYFIRIAPSNSSASTQYQLNLVATPFGGNISPEPGNTLPTARDLGVFSGTFLAKEYVGKIDSSDTYRFTLNDISSLQVSTKGSSANTQIQLIRDTNSNGLIDNGEILASNTNFSSVDLSEIIQDLPSGTYFISVAPRNASSSTLYEMNLVVTPFGGNISPDPGNALPAARDLGVLSGTFSAREHVGVLDSDDFYKFTLNNAASLQARATGLSAATRIQLIQDTNNNGLIDNNEVLASDTTFSSLFLSEITRDLQVGTYFIRVDPRNTSASTNYSLSLTV